MREKQRYSVLHPLSFTVSKRYNSMYSATKCETWKNRTSPFIKDMYPRSNNTYSQKIGVPLFLRQDVPLHEWCYHSVFAASKLPGTVHNSRSWRCLTPVHVTLLFQFDFFIYELHIKTCCCKNQENALLKININKF